MDKMFFEYFSEVSQTAGLSRLQKLHLLYVYDSREFRRVMGTVCDDVDCFHLETIVSLGKYRKALQKNGYNYPYWYDLVYRAYTHMTKLMEDANVCFSLEIAKRFWSIIDKSFKSSIMVLHSLYECDSEYLKLLEKKAGISPDVQCKIDLALKSETVFEVSSILHISRASVSLAIQSYITKINNVLQSELCDTFSEVYREWYMGLCTRAKTVLCREQCKSFDDVKVLLESDKVRGLGNVIRTRMYQSLQELDVI